MSVKMLRDTSPESYGLGGQYGWNGTWNKGEVVHEDSHIEDQLVVNGDAEYTEGYENE